MARTNFSGPTYGGEQILAQAQATSTSQAADASAVEFYETTVPTTEDWYVTRAKAYCTLVGNGSTMDVQDDGTTVLATAVTLVAAGPSTGGTVTADQGEVGKRVAAGSALTFKQTNGATTAATNGVLTVYGYKRYVG